MAAKYTQVRVVARKKDRHLNPKADLLSRRGGGHRHICRLNLLHFELSY